LPQVVAGAAQLGWTRDLSDRLIVGQSLLDGARLITGDKTIRKHCRTATWE
jgi:PIN domain nuclease of toxin-antitoxin system